MSYWHTGQGSPAPEAEPLVHVQYGNLEDFIGSDNALHEIEQIISDDTSYLTGFELPIELNTFSTDEQATLAKSVTHHDNQDWLPIFADTYNNLLPKHAHDEITQFSLKLFNLIMPSAYPVINVFDQASSLDSVFYLPLVQPGYQLFGTVGVEDLFSDHAAENLFKLPDVTSPTGYLNCASNVFASLLAGATGQTGRYVGMDALDPLFQQYFTEVTPPLQMGDIVRFMIPGNFHVFVYAGTDSDTGERIGFTKNGKELGPFMFMKYEDIYNIYTNFTISEVKYYRLSKAMPQNLFDQFPAVNSMPESVHAASRAVILPFVEGLIHNRMASSDIPVLRGNF